MIRRATIRLPVAVLITVGAAIISIMTGRADAAVLAAPWAVLLALGLTRANRPTVVGSVTTGSDRVLAGDPVEVVTRISGADGWVRAGFRPATGFWPTRIGESGDGHGSFVAAGTGSTDSTNAADVADVAQADRPTELRATLTAEAWGSHDVGRVEIEVHEPYGLLRWSGSLHTPSSLRVHPRPIDIQQLLTPFFVRRLTGAHRSRSVGRGVEYADIRHYTFGDSVRDINWRASARSQDLLVSERHPDRSTDVILLLDSFAESGHDMRSILGLAIEAAIGR